MPATGNNANAFPVIRQVIEKYDPKAKAATLAEFLGYRAKEDITALPPGYLVSGSQNVLHLSSGLIYNRPGYSLYGQAALNTQYEDGIISHYDWFTHLGFEQHIRVHNGIIEYSYVSGSTVTWLPLMTQKTMQVWNGTSTLFRFAEYWNTSEEIDELLFVNGDGNIYSWGGAMATLASVSSSALTVAPFLSNAEPTGVITFACSSQVTSLTGSTTTAGNSVIINQVNGQFVGYILMANQPANGDTITLTINSEPIVITFSSLAYADLAKQGLPHGTVRLGYNWTNLGSGTNNLYTQNISSPSLANTVFNLQQCLSTWGDSQGYDFVNFVAFDPSIGALISLLNINSSPVVSGSTTTAGNVISTSGNTLVFAMVNNPANGDTATFVLNGVSVQVQFVSVIGATAGNVLIGVNAQATLTNLKGLLTAPTTTNSTQVAFSANNALIAAIFTYSNSTGITLQGQQSWAELGFMNQTTGRGVIINGQVFGYTGGESGLTLTGVTPDPTTTPLPALTVGLPITQAPMVCPWTAVTSTVTNFNPNLIASIDNYIFYGNTTRRDFYWSKVNSAYDLTVNSPRIQGDGGTLTADAPITAFIVQEDSMYVSAGPDWLYSTTFEVPQVGTVTISGVQVATNYEPATLTPLKTSPGQGAISQEGVFKVKNSVFICTQEPAIDDLGRIADDLALPEAQTLTDSIKNDFLNYDLTGIIGVYNKYFLYVCLPAEQLMLVYNFFQAWWEPPQIVPAGRPAIINGDLYFHDSNVPQTYRFYIDNPLDPDTIYNDNGNPINAIANFSYNNFGRRFEKKQFTELGVEGYIKSNTTLTCGAKYDFGGYSGLQTFSLSGAVQSNLFYTFSDGSIGKLPLGKNPIGSITDSITGLPKFRHIFTMINIDFFEYQFFCQTNDVDQQWQLLAESVLMDLSDSGNNEIKS